MSAISYLDYIIITEMFHAGLLPTGIFLEALSSAGILDNVTVTPWDCRGEMPLISCTRILRCGVRVHVCRGGREGGCEWG